MFALLVFASFALSGFAALFGYKPRSHDRAPWKNIAAIVSASGSAAAIATMAGNPMNTPQAWVFAVTIVFGIIAVMVAIFAD